MWDWHQYLLQDIATLHGINRTLNVENYCFQVYLTLTLKWGDGVEGWRAFKQVMARIVFVYLGL